MKGLVLFVLLSWWCVGLRAASEGEGGGEGGKEITQSACAVSLSRLGAIFRKLIREDLTPYVNCLSFDEVGELEMGVLSGIDETGAGPGERMVLECVEGVILAMPSNATPNMTKNMACLRCNSEAESDICMTECRTPCERCYGISTNCTRCIACVEPEQDHCYISGESSTLSLASCRENCPETLIPHPKLFNFCDCPSGHYRNLTDVAVLDMKGKEETEERIVETQCINLHPELDDFTCTANCSSPVTGLPGFDPNEELHTCFACGLEYCLKCERNPDGKHYCLACMKNTILFDHECHACFDALVVVNAIEQEHELEEEERANKDRQIELAVTLPIMCILVILFFVGMSMFAHHRYPHLSPKGHKRHRTKPEDYEVSVDPVQNDFDVSTSPADIWRARPTVRLR